LFHGPASDETVNKTICGYIDLFYLTVNNNILTVQAYAQKASDFPFGAALILSNQNIIDLANRHIEDLGSLEKFSLSVSLRSS